MSRNDASGRCHYCRITVYPPFSANGRADPMCIATKDHWTPQAITDGANLPKSRTVMACQLCNGMRAHHPPEVFQFFIDNCSPGTATQKRTEWLRFVYLLTAAGFHVAMREARQSNAPVLSAGTQIAMTPLRDHRGRFTLRDLRRKEAA